MTFVLHFLSLLREHTAAKCPHPFWKRILPVCTRQQKRRVRTRRRKLVLRCTKYIDLKDETKLGGKLCGTHYDRSNVPKWQRNQKNTISERSLVASPKQHDKINFDRTIKYRAYFRSIKALYHAFVVLLLRAHERLSPALTTVQARGPTSLWSRSVCSLLLVLAQTAGPRGEQSTTTTSTYTWVWGALARAKATHHLSCSTIRPRHIIIYTRLH